LEKRKVIPPEMDPGQLAGVMMTRERNTKATGEPFDRETVEKVWVKAQTDLWFTFFKKDACGASIEKDEFGKQTMYGWEIDHIVPVSQGGTDQIENLQPLHWENNVQKGEDCAKCWCKVRG
jgi:hypothetical protein